MKNELAKQGGPPLLEFVSGCLPVQSQASEKAAHRVIIHVAVIMRYTCRVHREITLDLLAS